VGLPVCAELRAAASQSERAHAASGRVQEDHAGRLNELAERTTQLMTENVDQRDAMSSLMDILEKTMTVDDASELDDLLRAALREAEERLEGRLGEQAGGR
jgi:hypothetical protein